jgi:hypothetical protein
MSNSKEEENKFFPLLKQLHNMNKELLLLVNKLID